LVKAFCIPEEHTISCGAGRFVGDQVVRGEFVLHVDDDQHLTAGGVPVAPHNPRNTDDPKEIDTGSKTTSSNTAKAFR